MRTLEEIRKESDELWAAYISGKVTDEIRSKYHSKAELLQRLQELGTEYTETWKRKENKWN